MKKVNKSQELESAGIKEGFTSVSCRKETAKMISDQARSEGMIVYAFIAKLIAFYQANNPSNN